VSHKLRVIAPPFVVAPPGGARVRTRLRVSPDDETVLRALGAHLGRLAGVISLAAVVRAASTPGGRRLLAGSASGR
jgi:hypothetical protein